MKRCLLPSAVLTLLLILATPASAAAADRDARLRADAVVWAGLDYSLVRMIGPNDFRNPDAIFPDMLDKWNDLFLRERLGKLEESLHKRVTVDVAGIQERNRLATANQIILSPGAQDTLDQSHITPDDIAAAVKSYTLEAREGLGLVFIVDRLVKPKAKGALYVVFFDVKTREVITGERSTHPAGGGGFRNYWFRVVKEASSRLDKYR